MREVTKSFRADRSLLRRLRGGAGTMPRAVLDAVSLEVPRGQVFGLVGANGAGKTTLLKVLSTALLPDRGSVTVDGIDAVADPARVRMRLAVVPADERALFWRVSATENVRLFASLYGLTGRERDDAVARALDLVGLGEAGRQPVGSFSSGMRQRTLLARALVTQPPILVLDEPTRSLDPVTARELRRFIRDVLCVQLGTTIVLATHSTEEALQLCDRAALLVRGRIVATDTLPRLQSLHAGTRVRVRVDAAHADAARALLHVEPDAMPPVADGFVTFDVAMAAAGAGTGDDRDRWCRPACAWRSSRHSRSPSRIFWSRCRHRPPHATGAPMHRLLAVARAYALGMLTYRTRTIVSLLSVLVAVVPVYFIAGALQPIAAKAIATESTEYFTYLIVGSVASFVVAEAISAIPSFVGSYIASGTLEQLLTTPIRWPSLMAGLSLYGFGWVAMRALVLMGDGVGVGHEHDPLGARAGVRADH